MTVKELRDEAARLGVVGRSSMTKPQLEAAVAAATVPPMAAAPPPAVTAAPSVQTPPRFGGNAHQRRKHWRAWLRQTRMC